MRLPSSVRAIPRYPSCPMEQPLADLVGPDLRVLFCGINPGALSGQLRLHFARPGNRFWKLLAAGGFTPSVLAPDEQHVLPELGVGITNLVGRVTTAASELRTSKLRKGETQLEAKVGVLRPSCVAVLGLQAYRTAFRRPNGRSASSPNDSGARSSGCCPTPAASRPDQLPRDGADVHVALRRDSGGLTPIRPMGDGVPATTLHDRWSAEAGRCPARPDRSRGRSIPTLTSSAARAGPTGRSASRGRSP